MDTNRDQAVPAREKSLLELFPFVSQLGDLIGEKVGEIMIGVGRRKNGHTFPLDEVCEPILFDQGLSTGLKVVSFCVGGEQVRKEARAPLIRETLAFLSDTMRADAVRCP